MYNKYITSLTEGSCFLMKLTKQDKSNICKKHIIDGQTFSHKIVLKSVDNP